jgi:hypothetical protein
MISLQNQLTEQKQSGTDDSNLNGNPAIFALPCSRKRICCTFSSFVDDRVRDVDPGKIKVALGDRTDVAMSKAKR